MKKTILITGSTDGIGKLAATKLAKEGHTIYMHGRNPEKLAAAISEIKEAAQNQNVSGFAGDLSDMDSVKRMAQQIRDEVASLDVLINNAGIFMSPQPLNKDGIDMRLVVNYLAPFLLTRELLPLLEKGNEPRIISLSSAAQASVSLEALTGKEELPVQEAYAQSKLALTMWCFDLARKVPHIAVIAVNPGSLLNTKMVQEAYGRHWSSADKGASILHDLAVSDEYRGITGKYFDNDKGTFGPAHKDAYDEARIDRLITVTNNLLGLEK